MRFIFGTTKKVLLEKIKQLGYQIENTGKKETCTATVYEYGTVKTEFEEFEQYRVNDEMTMMIWTDIVNEQITGVRLLTPWDQKYDMSVIGANLLFFLYVDADRQGETLEEVEKNLKESEAGLRDKYSDGDWTDLYYNEGGSLTILCISAEKTGLQEDSMVYDYHARGTNDTGKSYDSQNGLL